MTQPDADDVTSPGWKPVAERPDRKRRLILVLVALLGVALAVLVAVTLLPRWWAQRIGDRVDGSFTAGVLTGLAIGAVLTLAALVVAALAFRRGASWKRRGLVLLGALVLASPNLTTLGIVLGRGSAAHAAERTLDVRAQGFRGATLVGAVVGVGLFVGLRWLLATRRRDRREVARLRDQLRQRDAGPTA